MKGWRPAVRTMPMQQARFAQDIGRIYLYSTDTIERRMPERSIALFRAGVTSMARSRRCCSSVTQDG